MKLMVTLQPADRLGTKNKPTLPTLQPRGQAPLSSNLTLTLTLTLTLSLSLSLSLTLPVRVHLQSVAVAQHNARHLPNQAAAAAVPPHR